MSRFTAQRSRLTLKWWTNIQGNYHWKSSGTWPHGPRGVHLGATTGLRQTFVQQDLLDEIHLDMCPVILGVGKPLFTDLTHRTNLRLRQAVPYDSGATTMYYEAVKTS